MSAEEFRKSPAHERLTEIANELDATSAHGAPDHHPSPYAERLQPAHERAATPAPMPQPTYEHPVYEQPVAYEQAPVHEQPVAAPASPSSPAYEQPAYDQLIFAQPAAAPAPVQPVAIPEIAAPESAASSMQPEPLPVSPSQAPPARASESVTRNVLVIYFPMLIAIISLGMSIYQGYLFQRSIELSQRSLDLVERNVARGEFMRTCRELSETFFELRPKIGVLMPTPDRGNVAGASRVSEHSRLEAQAVIARFGGLGTYLANFSQDPGTRARYTQMTRTLTGIMDSARTTPLTDLDKLFEPADKLFTTMNDDCVRMARTTRL
jgi:hypothetical protein